MDGAEVDKDSVQADALQCMEKELALGRRLADLERREQELASKERAFELQTESAKQPFRQFRLRETFQNYPAVQKASEDWQTQTNKAVIIKQSGEKKGFYQ
jgi:hypothetical protein